MLTHGINGFRISFPTASLWLDRLFLILLWANHQFRSNQLVKVLFTQSLQLHSRFLQCQSLLVCVLGYFASHIIANLWVEAGD